ncbi:MAG: APC family permease [Candidatus Hodarchaeota archaeon]
MSEAEPFVRKTSGLVRSLSAWDAMIVNILFMAPTAVFVYGIWGAGLWPGVHLPATALIAIPISIIIGFFYAIFSASMPRSGGDYIWVSRVIHPAIGFMINFFLFVILLQVAGSYIPWFAQLAIAPLLEFTGRSGAASSISGDVAMFIIAIIFYIFCAIIVTRGSKTTARVLLLFFIGVLIGLITYTLVMIGTSPSEVAANYQAATGESASNLIARAKADTDFTGKFTLIATLTGMQLTFINFLGFNTSIYLAGEIKEVSRAQFIAIIGSVIVFGLITWWAYQVTYAGFGSDFVGAIAALWETESFLFMFQFATDSTFIYSIVALGWACMTLSAILVYVYICVKLLFAWSFDRIVPTRLSEINPRFNSPVNALIVVTIVAMLLQAVWIWTDWAKYFAYLVFQWMIMQGIVAISALVFPKWKPDLFEASPAIVRRKVGPLYVLQWLGVATLIFSIYLGYIGITPTITGVTGPERWGPLGFAAFIFILAIVIYYISSFYHRDKIPLELSFKELPPE